MTALSFPLRHVSIRVPWHDNSWNGTICNQPRYNTACLKLMNIAESKVEADEETVRGQSLKDMEPARFPPCVKDRSIFMAPFPLDRLHEHPYVKTAQDTHAHFKPTRLRDPVCRRRGGEEQHWYREHTVEPREQGGGPKGTLIVTRDQPDGGIDSAVISALIAKIGGR